MLSDSSSHRMVDEALTILSVLASNLDAKAAIVKANTLPALIGILQTGQARNRENAAAILLSLWKRDNEKLVAIGIESPQMDSFSMAFKWILKHGSIFVLGIESPHMDSFSMAFK
ncbi:hypothetical protein YC2023_023490 [Brassica napus]